MNASRTNALIVGILFIIGTVTGLIVAAMTNPILGSPDYLNKVAANDGLIMTASFLYFVMAISCAGIGLAMYPMIKPYREDLAVGAAGFRVIEGVIQVIGSVSMISLLALSQAFVRAGGGDTSHFHTLGTIIKAGSDWLSNGPMLLAWCIAAMMYYSVFYQFKLVPRWLSAWGLAGISLTILACIFVMLNLLPSFGTIQTIANMPILFQELVFAVWLIVKGTYPASTTSQSDVPNIILPHGAINEGNR